MAAHQAPALRPADREARDRTSFVKLAPATWSGIRSCSWSLVGSVFTTFVLVARAVRGAPDLGFLVPAGAVALVHGAVRELRRGDGRRARQGPGRRAAQDPPAQAKRLEDRRRPASVQSVSSSSSQSGDLVLCHPRRSSSRATARSSTASPRSTSRRSPASPHRSSASRAATARRSPAGPRCSRTSSSSASPRTRARPFSTA